MCHLFLACDMKIRRPLCPPGGGGPLRWTQAAYTEVGDAGAEVPVEQDVGGLGARGGGAERGLCRGVIGEIPYQWEI